jgi:iron complex transport system ATP-binding protein
MAMSDFCQVSNLSLSFDRKRVLDDVSFSIQTGSHVAIVGPNGAGKTTLLRCLNGLISPDSGEVLLSGRTVDSYPSTELARLVAYVPQAGDAQFPFTVKEFVAMGRYPYLSPFTRLQRQDLEAIDRALEITGLQDLSSRVIATLSGGEAQRLFIAAAVAQGAPTMLLDEPATFLDPKHEREVLAILEKLNREQKVTLIVVTHDLNAAARYASRIIALKEGRVEFSGTGLELMSNTVLEPLFGMSFSFAEHPQGGRLIIPE